MRLNLASGQHPTALPGWINLDLPWGGVDRPHVYADGRRMPFPDGCFEAAYLGHFLEHLPWESLAGALADLHRVLRPRSPVMVVGPAIERAVSQQEPQFILEAIIGEGDEGPGGHQWVATERLTLRAMCLAGLTDVSRVDVATVLPPEWPNPTTAAWQCAGLGYSSG